MRYCIKCIVPETRPNISFDDYGNCNCATKEKKSEIDWDSRQEIFSKICEETVRNNQKAWDCVVPVSGGKDSTWQVIKCLEYGLRPLAVTWKTPVRTELGQRNLNNLIAQGVDHIDFQINPDVESYFTLKTFKEKGSPAIPMHMALFSIPLQIATKFKIPLVIWGENSAFEYGGDEESQKGFELNNQWLLKYGVTQGTVAADWQDSFLTKKMMSAYQWPTDFELKSAGVKAIFLGSYFKWDPLEVAEFVMQKGFQQRKEGPATGLYKFADIDDEFIITIHHYIKWFKFGFTRLFDNLSIEIRNGRMTRDQAIEHLKKTGPQTPHEEIEKFCRYVKISKSEFWSIMDTFRNQKIWSKENNIWKIKDFIIDDWDWSL